MFVLEVLCYFPNFRISGFSQWVWGFLLLFSFIVSFLLSVYSLASIWAPLASICRYHTLLSALALSVHGFTRHHLQVQPLQALGQGQKGPKGRSRLRVEQRAGAEAADQCVYCRLHALSLCF